MDTAIASSIGDTYGANLQPMEQLKHCVKIFNNVRSIGNNSKVFPYISIFIYSIWQR